jgi:hypothetical protein
MGEHAPHLAVVDGTERTEEPASGSVTSTSRKRALTKSCVEAAARVSHWLAIGYGAIARAGGASAVARRLGVHPSTACNWADEHRTEATMPLRDLADLAECRTTAPLVLTVCAFLQERAQAALATTLVAQVDPLEQLATIAADVGDLSRDLLEIERRVTRERRPLNPEEHARFLRDSQQIRRDLEALDQNVARQAGKANG